MTVEEVPIEIVELIKEKPIVAYKLLLSLCAQALMAEGITHTKDDVDLVIYNYIESVQSKPLAKEDLN